MINGHRDQFPMLEIVKHLENTTIQSLSSVSKDVNISVNKQLYNAVLWKHKLGKVLDLEVPFDKTGVDYWKDLYTNVTNSKREYSEDKLLKALETGK